MKQLAQYQDGRLEVREVPLRSLTVRRRLAHEPDAVLLEVDVVIGVLRKY